MADEPVAPIAESPVPAAAPAVSEAPPTPIAPEAVPSAPVAAEVAPVTAPIVTEAKPAEAAAPTEPVSLLGDAAQPAPEPKAEAKPEGEKPAAEAKPEGEAPVPEEARAAEPQLPTYEPFTVPEGVELDDPQVDRFIGSVAAVERDINPTGDPKVHAAFQGLIQNLADQYTEEIAGIPERIAQANAATFSRTMENWKDEFFNDPEIGGNRKDTTIRNAHGVISRFGGSAQQVAELRQVLSHTGAGNNIHVIRLINNIAGFLSEGTPVPATKPEPQTQSRTERRYGKKG